jgi:hypothetical protein
MWTHLQDKWAGIQPVCHAIRRLTFYTVKSEFLKKVGWLCPPSLIFGKDFVHETV